MFFLAFCVLQLIFNFSSTEFLNKSIYNQFKLVKNINTFYHQSNSKETTSKKVKTYSSISVFTKGGISEPMFEAFENDLLYLLQQLNNYYYKKLPTFEEVQKIKNENQLKFYDVQKQSKYEQAICKHMPQCMNFIYTTNGSRPTLILLYKFHTLLCTTIPKFFAQNCNRNFSNSNTYNCENNKIYLLYLNILPIDKIKNVDTNKKYQEKGEKFIMKMFKLISNIDIIPMIIKKPGIHEIIFNNISKENSKYNFKPTYVKQGKQFLTNTNYENLNNKMKEINMHYYLKIIKQCDASVDLTNNELTSIMPNNITTKLLLYTFTRLEKHLRFNIFTPGNPVLPKNGFSSNENDIKILMSEMFDKLCKHLPLILFYTNDNNEIDRKLFSMYFTFCGDYTTLFSIRCPDLRISIFYKHYDVKCIIKVIQEKIQMNFISLTGKVSTHDKYVNNSQCTDANYNYIKEIYEIIQKSYEGTFIPLWTTYEWSSGKYFLMDEKNYKSTDMKNLQQQTLLIDNVPLTLLEISSKLLPWTSNMKAILTFQGNIFYKIKEIINTYVYRLVQIIILFAEYMNYSVENKELESLKRSIDWYKYASTIIDNQLYFSGYYSNDGIIRAILFEIKNVNHIHCIKKIKSEIPESMESELKEWSSVELQKSKENSTIVTLNKMAENNCKNAMDFISDLISILIKSNLMQKENQNNDLKLYEVYCLIPNLFYEKNVD